MSPPRKKCKQEKKQERKHERKTAYPEKLQVSTYFCKFALYLTLEFDSLF
jgi:hypothetical protein